MSRVPATPSRLLAAAAVLALGGCVSLLPKQPPAQLYRFGAADADPAAPAADDGAARFALAAPPPAVAPEAAGDRILTVTGAQAAYIAGARWVAPAAVLWEEAERRAFAARSARVRLQPRNEFAGAAAVLRVDVPRFEVRYPAPGAAPTVAVSVHALLQRRGGELLAERTFAAAAPAAEDRVSAITAAVDVAVAQTLSGLVAWTDARAPEAAASPPAEPAAAAVVTTTTRSSAVRTVTTPPRP